MSPAIRNPAPIRPHGKSSEKRGEEVVAVPARIEVAVGIAGISGGYHPPSPVSTPAKPISSRALLYRNAKFSGAMRFPLRCVGVGDGRH